MGKLLVLICVFFMPAAAFARQGTADSARTTSPARPARENIQRNSDTLKSKYVNPGKVAARKAVLRSAIIPGWGQLRNYSYLVNKTDENGRKTAQFWEKGLMLGKTAGVYVAGTLLTIALIDNNKKYDEVLFELQYRAANNGQSPPGSRFASVSNTTRLVEAKDVYERNREVIYFSYVITYAANLIDTYVSARLNYFDVDQNLKIGFRPTLIPTNQMFGYNFAPGLKVTLKL